MGAEFWIHVTNSMVSSHKNKVSYNTMESQRKRQQRFRHGLSLVPEEGEEEQGYSSTISMKTAAIQL